MTIHDYSVFASEYDKKRFESRDGVYNSLTIKSCIDSLLPNKRVTVLDIGTGTGEYLCHIKNKDYPVIGLDFTMEMLNRCKRKLINYTLRNDCFSLVRADAFCLPFPDNSIPVVVSLNFLHLFSLYEQKIIIDECVRVMSNKAMMICQFNNLYRSFLGGKRTLRENSTLHLNKKSDFKFIFSNPNIKITKICGSSLPFVWRIFQYFPDIGLVFERFAKSWPLCLISPSFFVVALKTTK